MALIKFKRGTRSQLDVAAAASELNQGEPYYVTDESVVAIGAAADSAVDLAKASDLTTHTGSTTAHGISTFGASLVDDADAAAARTTLGLSSASQAEMEAGTETALRSMSPLLVAQAIAALGGSTGVFPFYRADGTSDSIGLTGDQALPFYESDGSANNIPLVI